MMNPSSLICLFSLLHFFGLKIAHPAFYLLASVSFHITCYFQDLLREVRWRYEEHGGPVI